MRTGGRESRGALRPRLVLGIRIGRFSHAALDTSISRRSALASSMRFTSRLLS